MKFWVTAQPGVSYLPFIRSSEMVLIEAEANYFLGNTADAQAALVKLNATTGRNASYTCTKTGTDLFNEIRITVRLSFGVKALHGVITSVGTFLLFATHLLKVVMHTLLLQKQLL